MCSLWCWFSINSFKVLKFSLGDILPLGQEWFQKIAKTNKGWQFPPLSLKTSLTSGLVQRQTKDPFVDRIKFTIIISKKNSKTRVCRSNQTCQSNDPSSRRRLNLWAKWCDVVANSIL
ncbi:hypothetical protein RCL_jg29660.t1 [Rhizophagus clarus]|uniref:Uncharacterized protein n=1 Tax=Rhizophagus clarus TaxID=94130 RepID=A0A8H3L141_9GLOM|nr:hypothetical protein RCL_jg29660.t1 [Rhizophagus clarus]